MTSATTVAREKKNEQLQNICVKKLGIRNGGMDNMGTIATVRKGGSALYLVMLSFEEGGGFQDTDLLA
eukprot:CAMPEP_0171424610 /NCGR_PEP_ID=MMETSP0881-20121228/2789_1 /TAXON_ID=67004 /ORGANISM="Thalassiosira weissflogii, Strain CCMP1336" /LENGTH=67 /DNA_ID=CAMNT_0011943787 /DNA_START=1612 /DNA_END=1815 /DNA_ORIENTATION=-